MRAYLNQGLESVRTLHERLPKSNGLRSREARYCHYWNDYLNEVIYLTRLTAYNARNCPKAYWDLNDALDHLKALFVNDDGSRMRTAGSDLDTRFNDTLMYNTHCDVFFINVPDTDEDCMRFLDDVRDAFKPYLLFLGHFLFILTAGMYKN